MDEYLDIKEFFIEGGDQKKSHVLLHITEPTTPAEYKKGYFFALIEVSNGKKIQIHTIQEIIDTIESNYYDTDQNNTLEDLLEAANRKAPTILENKKSTINCVIGVINKNHISFSFHGTPNVVLFYNKKNILRHINVITKDTEKTNPGQLFSAMMEGNINTDDFFYIATPHVSNAFTEDRIKKIISSRTLTQSIIHIEKVLQNLRNEYSYGGIFFKSITPKIKKSLQTTAVQPNSPTKNLQKNNPGTQNQPIETNLRHRKNKPKENLFSIILIAVGKALVATSFGIFRILKKIMIGVWKILVALIIIITNHGNNRQSVIDKIKKKIEEKRMYVVSLPLTSKLLFIFTILFAIVFIGSISYLKIKEQKEIVNQNYQNTVQSIIDKTDAALAAMIYNDDNKAFILLKEAQITLFEIPTDTTERENKKNELESKIEISLQKLQKLNVINPIIITNLKEINENANATKIVAIEDTIIAYGPNDTTHYLIDQDTKSVETKQHDTIPNLIAASTPKEDDTTIFITGENKIASFNKDSGTLSNKEISTPNKNSQLIDLTVYNTRIYSLDPINNQIYKHNKTQTGFDQGTPWIKENTDISDGISITIDGDIFVLKRNGQIIKFESGSPAEFEIKGLDPELDQPSIIWTYNDIEHLYILEPTNKRVIILDKSGKLINQFTSLDWQNPTGMLVDEEKKTIYVLDSNKLYEFKIDS